MATESTTIFVADDNPVLLQGLDRALRSSGYSVHTALDGASLLELLESADSPPDLLLLDVMMPGMTGLDVLRKLQDDPRWADVPVMLITAASDDTLPVAAMQGGATDFLAKPFRLGELLARVDAHVQRYRKLRRVRSQAQIRLQASDVVRDLNAAVTASEMFDLVTTRSAEIWGIRRCSVVVYDSTGKGRVLASSDADDPTGLPLDLATCAEVQTILDTGVPLLVPDLVASPPCSDMAAGWKQGGDGTVELRSLVVVPLPLTESTRGALILRSMTDEPVLDHESVSVAGQIVEAMIHALGRAHMFETLIEQRRQLDTLAHTDELTGCATRRSLLSRLKEESFLARRHRTPLSVVLFDLDGFKDINDTYGHLAGDAVLRSFGGWLQGQGALRARDCAGRFGGDEFMVVLPDTAPDGALSFAERARAFIQSVPFDFDGTRVRVTLSAGVATWAGPDAEASTPERLIGRADQALYAAKAAGRDTIRLADSDPAPSTSSE